MTMKTATTYYQPGKRTQAMEKKYEVRKANLHLLLERHNGPSNLARALGYNGPSYLSQMASGHRHITEENARRVERELALDDGWMDVEHTADEVAPPTQPLCTSLLREVVQHVASALDESGIKLSPAKLSEFIVMVYEEAAESGRIDARFISKTVRLMS